jgi:hypothetical protein
MPDFSRGEARDLLLHLFREARVSNAEKKLNNRSLKKFLRATNDKYGKVIERSEQEKFFEEAFDLAGLLEHERERARFYLKNLTRELEHVHREGEEPQPQDEKDRREGGVVSDFLRALGLR